LLTWDNPWKSLGAELVLIKTHSTVGALLDSIETIGATTVAFNHLYGMFSLVP
jgi:cryptochrome 2